jgi:hypothetical protein
MMSSTVAYFVLILWRTRLPMYVAGREAFLDWSTKKMPVLLLGLYPWVYFLVMTNELHVGE